MDNQQVYDLLMRAINEQVTNDVQKRIENLRNWLIVVVLILTSGGTVLLKYYVDNTIANAVPPAVEEAVPPAVLKAAGVIRFESEVAALNFRILNLNLSDSFAGEEAEAIILEIQSLVDRGVEQSLSKLAFALNTAATNFAAADRLDLVNRLVDIAPDWAENSPVITFTMVLSLGSKLLGDAGAPESWTETTGSKRRIYESYRTYIDKVELSNRMELYLLYEILLAHIEGRPMEVISNMIGDVDSLNEADAEIFLKLMVNLATEASVSKSTAESKRVADRVKAFLCEYGNQSKLLFSASQEAHFYLDKCPVSGA